MKQTMEVARGTLLCRRLGVLVAAAGLAVAGCANNGSPASSPAPAPPAVTSAPPAQPQPATLDWARSMCQSLQPAFDRLGAPPQPDLGNLAATRQVYIDYLGDARNAVQQAIDQPRRSEPHRWTTGNKFSTTWATSSSSCAKTSTRR